MREPNRTQRRVRSDLARDEGLALPEGRGPVDQPRRHGGEHPGHVREIGHRVHPHQDQVVALREHVLVDLLRPLGHHDEVEPELPPFTRDPYRVLGGESGEWIDRVRGTHVLRFVDDYGHRLAAGPLPPQPLENRARGECLLLPGGERAQVHHQAPRALRAHDLVQQRRTLRPGPDAEAIDSEVACAQLQVLCRRLGQILEAADRLVLHQGEELAVLGTVAEWVEAQQAGLVGGAEVAEADA